MGYGRCGSKKKREATYVCVACGKKEIREVKEGEEVKSCCGQLMKRK